jgi:hypothetical protein
MRVERTPGQHLLALEAERERAGSRRAAARKGAAGG